MRRVPSPAKRPEQSCSGRGSLQRGPARAGGGLPRAARRDLPCLSEAPRSRPRMAVREALCELPAARPERAGRGMARYGRHRLAADSANALRMVGAFGTVSRPDFEALFETRARGAAARRQLAEQGLLQVEGFHRGGRRVEVVSLTGSGRRLLERGVDPRDPSELGVQRYRSGPARSAQVLHDAAVYRAARLEMDRLEQAGRRVRRILTDGDLKRQQLRRIRKERALGAAEAAAREAAARQTGLALRDGSAVYPDIRIEWGRDAGGGVCGHVDVEVTTEDYRASTLEAKVAAGFRMYCMAPDGSLAASSPQRDSGMAR